MVKLGDKVEDIVTDFTGVVVEVVHWLNGCDRCVVQSIHLDEKGLPKKDKVFDALQLKVVHRNLIQRRIDENVNNPLPTQKVGDKVTDKITGFTGVVVAISEFLCATPRCGVQSQKLDEKGQPLDACWFDQQRLTVVVQKEVSTKSQGTGGPTPSSHCNPDPQR